MNNQYYKKKLFLTQAAITPIEKTVSAVGVVVHYGPHVLSRIVHVWSFKKCMCSGLDDKLLFKIPQHFQTHQMLRSKLLKFRCQYVHYFAVLYLVIGPQCPQCFVRYLTPHGRNLETFQRPYNFRSAEVLSNPYSLLNIFHKNCHIFCTNF